MLIPIEEATACSPRDGRLQAEARAAMNSNRNDTEDSKRAAVNVDVLGNDPALMPRVLLIDNYDSYSFNLFQLLASLPGWLPPLVVQNDDFGADWATLCAALVPGEAFHALVVSPGPGSPDCIDDVGLSVGALQSGVVPVLGVCLGHQLLAYCLGAKVRRADIAVHGQIFEVHHDSDDEIFGCGAMFQGVPSPFKVVRYHSLVVDDKALPPSVQVVARTACGVVMAIRDRDPTRLAWGLQFHPESVCSDFGATLAANFLEAAQDFVALNGNKQIGHGLDDWPRKAPIFAHNHLKSADGVNEHQGIKSERHCSVVVLPVSFEGCACSLETVFESLFDGCSTRFWLDSAMRDPLGYDDKNRVSRSRFSYMGDSRGPMARLVEVYIDPAKRSFNIGHDSQHPEQLIRVRMRDAVSGRWVSSEADEESTSRDIFQYLEASLGELGKDTMFRVIDDSFDFDFDSPSKDVKPIKQWDLPFPFAGGYVGYFGFALRRLCGVKSCGVGSKDGPEEFSKELKCPNEQRVDPKNSVPEESKGPHGFAGKAQACGGDAFVPDVTFLLVDRFLAWDHATNMCYVVAVHESCNDASDTTAWVRSTAHCLQELKKTSDEPKDLRTRISVTESSEAPLRALVGNAEYKKNVEQCIEFIKAGETYEVCLTRQLSRPNATIRSNSFQFYKSLRSTNPAPYAAFFEVHDEQTGQNDDDCENLELRSANFSVCCSSPERFLCISACGEVESKPIKGTIARHKDAAVDAALAEELRTSVKDRAENLMIVDLVRNDLGRVCEVGSIVVPSLMQIESFTNVHQLVSTVRGQLAPGRNVMEVIRAAFPGGSMTGAPKLRSMQILDKIEPEERGVYSGALGFISLTGAVDLNIVIRTAVLTPLGVSVGAGGAIVVLSDPQTEVDEADLKAKKLQDVVRAALCNAANAPEVACYNHNYTPS